MSKLEKYEVDCLVIGGGVSGVAIARALATVFESIFLVEKNQKHTYGKISIGEGVWIAAHVKILAGVSIGDGAVIGANAVVTKDVPENGVMVGIPAKNVGTATEKFKPYGINNEENNEEFSE